MKYMLLIYNAESAHPAPNSPAMGKLMEGYGAFTQDVQSKGIMVAGDGLQGLSTATTVRKRNGKVNTVDGPFAETKEMLAGFYILDCKNLDEAIEYAARIPTAEFGSIEVRPVMVYE